MFAKTWRIVIVCAFLTPVAMGEPEPLTAGELFVGSKVPKRREFPLNDKVKPCDDFHRYVCENVEKSFRLPKDRSRWIFSFSDSGERLLDAKKAFFKKLTEGYQPKLPRTKNVRRLYRSCMEKDARAGEEKRYVAVSVKKVTAVGEPEALRKLIQARHLTPEFSFVTVYQDANHENPSRSDLVMLAAGLTLPEKRFYKDKSAVEDVRKLAVAFFKAVALDQPDKRAEAVIAYENGLAEVYPTSAEFRELYSANTYLKAYKWSETYPQIGFENIYARVPSRVGLRNLTQAGFVYLNSYLAQASVFDLQSVLLYNTLRDIMDDGFPEFFKDYFEFQRKHYGGAKERPSRSERCTKLAMAHFGMELDAELIDILFPSSDEKMVTEVAEAVRESILKGLKANTWLSEPSRKGAIRKIKEANLKLVRPQDEKDWNFLDIVALTDDRPLENLFTIQRAEINRMLTKVRQRRNRDEWLMSPLTVNAYYSPSDNTFVLPRGILQFPFFDARLSRIENLAAMGMVVGHELGHGIDDEGSKYDDEGVLRKWMTDEDLKKFAERGGKLVEQFNKIGHDGKLTLGENIGDNVGLQFALDAAFPKSDKADMEDVKKFFISYGRLWCGTMTPEYRKVYLKTNPHSTHEARINEQVKHKDLFHKAFACGEGDKMYLPPEERVQVW